MLNRTNSPKNRWFELSLIESVVIYPIANQQIRKQRKVATNSSIMLTASRYIPSPIPLNPEEAIDHPSESYVRISNVSQLNGSPDSICP